MKSEQVLTTVNIPELLYRRLEKEAAAQGCSVYTLILCGVENVLTSSRPLTRRVQLPLIRSEGPTVPLSNEQIYKYVEFP